MSKKHLKITIFGVGCLKYKAFAAQVHKAVEELDTNKDIDASVVEIEEIEDVDSFMLQGIEHIPAIAVNGALVTNGEVPDVALLKKAIKMNYEL